MKVRDIMSSDLACCTPDTSLQEVAKMMVDCDCGGIPIVEGEGSQKPIGFITDRDITCRIVAKGENPLQHKARDAMTSPPQTIGQDADLKECERQMEQLKVRRILVIDDNGACCGIVAQADIARKAPEHDTAEVVRDISQPSDQPSQPAWH